MKTVITIGRQLGSNGRVIGRALAEKLGYKFYDKELIARVAKESGLNENIFQDMDEKPTNSLLYSLVMGIHSGQGIYYPTNDFLNGDNLFRIQADLIKEIAREEPCVIVGRCADYILRENPYLIRLFLHAPADVRIKTVSDRASISQKDAKSAVTKADKRRSNYYSFYTSNSWGNVDNYDLCLDTSSLPQEACVDFLYSYVREKEKSFKD